MSTSVRGKAVHTVLICDHVGLALDQDGRPDPSVVRTHIEARGGTFHEGSRPDPARMAGAGVHFFYHPGIGTRDELLAAAGEGAYDAVIAAATIIPEEARFTLGGVRIGAGTGNMRSSSWGGGDGRGGEAPLMNTPGFNSVATAQMVMKAILAVAPDLPVATLHDLVAAGRFDTGRDLVRYPTAKLEGRRLAVLGYGNIGRAVARLGAAFGMEVTVAARSRHREWIEAEGYRYASTPAKAAADADVLTIHVGLGARDAATGGFANAGLVDGAVLDRLVPGAILVNYDRGEVVDIGALDRALGIGRVSHAAIDADIFVDPQTGEVSGPLAPYRPLAARHPGRVTLLPHAAADTDHPSRVAGACQAVDQILDAIEHRIVVNVVGDVPPGYQAGGRRGARGVERVDTAMLGDALDDAMLDVLREHAHRQATGWAAIASAQGAEARKSAIATVAPSLLKAVLSQASILRRAGLQGPFAD